MEILRLAIGSLTVVSLMVAAVQVYLILNKLWIRKHEPAVAGSISIMGETLGVVPLSILSLNYAIDGYWEGMVDSALWIVAGGVTILIGTGRWVEGNRRRGLWTLIREAVRLERDEVGDLARSFFRPSGARQVLDILGQIALLDSELDQREREFVDRFADAWGVDFDWAAVEGGDQEVDFVRLRRSVESYLSTSPPAGQVGQLADAVTALVRIDRQTTSEEELMLEELVGMFGAYTGDDDRAGFVVAVVPQDPEQDQTLTSLLPGRPKHRVQGGLAYSLGPFFSSRYADIVADQYRRLNFFATVVEADAEAVSDLQDTPEPNIR
jgi:hypothetical protein